MKYAEQLKCGCVVNCPLHKSALDLYEALKYIVTWMDEWKNPEFEFSNTYNQAKQAIAKAEDK